MLTTKTLRGIKAQLEVCLESLKSKVPIDDVLQDIAECESHLVDINKELVIRMRAMAALKNYDS